ATVIDVGMNRIPDPAKGEGKTRLVGDVAFDEAVRVAGAITPVPGGVGPMTIPLLMASTLDAACRSLGRKAPMSVSEAADGHPLFGRAAIRRVEAPSCPGPSRGVQNRGKRLLLAATARISPAITHAGFGSIVRSSGANGPSGA